jgi:hypothetical protein
MPCTGGCPGWRSLTANVELVSLRFPLKGAGPLETVVEDERGQVLDSVSRDELSPDSTLTIRWTGGGFFARHWLLGEIAIEALAGNRDSEAASTGTVRPVAVEGGEGRSAARAFFPARNENELWFRIRVPRFGLVFENEEPVVNEAEITQIPPVGSVYKLRAPVLFRSPRRRGLKLRIAACVVQTLAEEHLEATVIEVKRDGDDVIVEAEVRNTSPLDRVTVLWAVAAVSGGETARAHGRERLKRRPKRIKMRLPGAAKGQGCDTCFRAGIVAPAPLSGSTSAELAASLA